MWTELEQTRFIVALCVLIALLAMGATARATQKAQERKLQEEARHTPESYRKILVNHGVIPELPSGEFFVSDEMKKDPVFGLNAICEYFARNANANGMLITFSYEYPNTGKTHVRWWTRPGKKEYPND